MVLELSMLAVLVLMMVDMLVALVVLMLRDAILLLKNVLILLNAKLNVNHFICENLYINSYLISLKNFK